MENINIAICYFGMTRSTKYVYKSHYEHVFNVFKQNSINFDVYMHTWKTEHNIINENVYKEPINYEEYKLLNPTVYKIDEQCDFLNSIVFSNYFDETIYKKNGGDSPHEWKPELIRNHLCALESQKRCYQLSLDSGKPYKYIMFIRPDVLIKNNINCDLITKSVFDIIILNTDHNEGYNDRFAIIPFVKAEKYALRINEISDFKKKRAELYLKNMSNILLTSITQLYYV